MKGLLKNSGIILILTGVLLLITGNPDSNRLLAGSVALMIIGIVVYIILNKRIMN